VNRSGSVDANNHMPNIGPMELILVAIIALVVLGPKRLPDAGRSLGRGMREFKSAISGSHDDDRPVLREADDADAHKAPTAA
jgi:sec-independent protein translocase protein TatA